MSKKVAKELLKIARQLVAGQIKWTQGEDYFKSFRSMVKYGDGLWKSEKQGKYMMSQLKRGSWKPSDELEKMILSKKPREDFKGIFYTSTVYNPGGQFGRKGRILAYAYFVDDFGIVRELKVKMKHNDEWGTAYPEGVQVTFDRPDSVAEGLVKTVDPWFAENKDDIDLVIEQLEDHDYFARFVEELKDGDRVNDNMFKKMVEEAERMKSKGSLDSFPKEPTETTLEIKVGGIKVYTNEVSYRNWVSSFVVWGYDNRYQERVSVKLTEKTFDELCKKHGIDTEHSYVDYNQDAIDKLKGKTIKLKGKFISDGDAIKKVDRTRLKIACLRIAKELKGASEIKHDELPDEQKKLLKELGRKTTSLWEGIHGYIATFDDERLTKDDIKKLSRNKVFRWIESSSYGGLTIGF